MPNNEIARLLDLTGSVAVVTGGTGGIGLGIAERLGGAGAKLVVCSRNEENCTIASKSLRSQGIDAIGVVVDVRDESAVQGMVSKAIDRYGRIDTLVNCAGGSFSDSFKRGPLLSLSAEDFTESYRLNVVGAFLCSKAVLPMMQQSGGGSIVHVSSMAGRAPSAGLMGAYGAAKAALNNLTKTMGREFAPAVRVNAVAPGHIETARTSANRSAERIAVITKEIALGRFGTPMDVADLVCFLASSAASWITASVFDIDGGDTGVG